MHLKEHFKLVNVTITHAYICVLIDFDETHEMSVRESAPDLPKMLLCFLVVALLMHVLNAKRVKTFFIVA